MNIIAQLTDQPTREEIQQACYGTIGTPNERIFYGDVFDELRTITKAQSVLHRVAKSEGPLFLVENKKRHPSPTFIIRPIQSGIGFLELIFQRVSSTPDKYPEHSFSAEVMIFKKIIEKIRINDLQRFQIIGLTIEMADTIYSDLNACVDSIREEFNSPMFEERRRKHTKASLKNQRGGYRWLDHILNRHARLCAIRIDLTYLQQYQCESSDLHAVTVKESFVHRERFLRKLPSWIKDGALLGYMLKTEYTLRRSIHHHALIVLDGSKLRSDITIAALIGQKWAGEITQRRGSFRNVNSHTEKTSPNCGIGDVCASDWGKVDNLKTKVISYLCKPDHLVRWVVSNKHRLFLKSVNKTMTGLKRGRRRTRIPSLNSPSKAIPLPENELLLACREERNCRTVTD